MPLVDIPQSTVAAKTQATIRIRQVMAGLISNAEVGLLKVRNLVREHGRSTIEAELDKDAAELMVVYTKLKEAVEAAKKVSVEDLP